MALERPLWRFAHPHFCVCVKPLRGFFQRKRKNVANLLSLSAIIFEFSVIYIDKLLFFV
jgi:hypothetical protein